MKLVWRAVVFVVTLMSIYLAFPILIVPSSLPAIQELVSMPEASSADLGIYQLEIERVPTLKDKLLALAAIHRQGRYLIWQWLTQTAF